MIILRIILLILLGGNYGKNLELIIHKLAFNPIFKKDSVEKRYIKYNWKKRLGLKSFIAKI